MIPTAVDQLNANQTERGKRYLNGAIQKGHIMQSVTLKDDSRESPTLPGIGNAKLSNPRFFSFFLFYKDLISLIISVVPP